MHIGSRDNIDGVDSVGFLQIGGAADQGDVCAAVNQGIGLNVLVFAVKYYRYNAKPDLFAATGVDTNGVAPALRRLVVPIWDFFVIVE